MEVVNMCAVRLTTCRSFIKFLRPTPRLCISFRHNSTNLNRSAVIFSNAYRTVPEFRLSSVVFCRSLLLHGHSCAGSRLEFNGAGVTRANYSTQKESAVGSLTGDILKAKIPVSPAPTDGESPTAGGDSASGQKKSSKRSDSSWFSSKNAWKLGLVSLAGMGILMFGNALLVFGRPQLDEDGAEIPDEFSELPVWQAYVKRTLKEARFFTKMIQEPSSMKLLPDTLKEPWVQPPYTLVLEMTGVLVHPDWTLATGWRFKKRPGLDYFLQSVAPPLFEVVIYTHEQGFTAFPIIDGLDPNGFVMFRLFRDATRYMNGTHVKDLACLNRDLSKVIIIDCDSKAIGLQPQNALMLKKWNGDDSDRSLIDVAAFLKTIALSDVADVRPVLEHYSQFDDPIAAFKEKQRQLQAQQEQIAAGEQHAKKKSIVGGWSFGISGLKKN